MSNPITEMRKRRDQKQIELTKLGYTFSPVISFDYLSVGEMTDLSELEIGQSTYIGETGDITRTA